MEDDYTILDDDDDDEVGEDQWTTGDARTAETGGVAVSAGERVGAYQLLERLGQGGMGEVWLAEQLVPVRRKVAFKVIKRGMDTEQVVARFEAERQALALMDHPAVAKVFDAGSTPRGRPFFVMEYVPGEPITTHCDRHRLTVRQRLELFQLVCQGVQHAHQKALIHRDLKPSNVLVSMQDDRPVPKIIDFGIAKATGPKLTDQTMHTELGAMVGTPEYMSPEQAGLTGEDVDTRADVYSLGVMLYELLAGRLPFEPKELRAEGYEGMRRRICEEDPPRPSTHIGSGSDEAFERARDRGTDPGNLRRTLAIDLDWIAMKALEKDRRRRYESPAELAADLQRYLDHQPIVARPPNVGYRARKFVRRHRFGVALGASLSIALIAGTVGTAVGLVRATDETRKAQAVTKFLIGVLSEGNPEKAKGQITVGEALDRAVVTVEASFESEPKIEAVVRDTIAIAYHELGRFEDAALNLRRARELYERELGPRHPMALAARGKLARAAMDSGRLDEAETETEELLPIFQQAFGPDDRRTLALMHNLAALYLHQERYAKAEPVLLDLAERRAKVLGRDDWQYLATTANLATLYVMTDRLAEAEPLYVEAYRVRGKTLGPLALRTLMSAHHLGDYYGKIGRYAEGEPLLREALAGFRAVVGEDKPQTLEALDGLVRNLVGQERWAEAEAEALENLRRFEFSFGPDDERTTSAAAFLATLRERTPHP